MEDFLKNYGSWLLVGGFSILMIGIHLWSARAGHGGGCGMGGNDHDHKEKGISIDNGNDKNGKSKTAAGCH